MSDALPTASPDERCPRCGSAFHCGARDPGPCACTQLRLAPDVLMAMRSRWARCLCLACLQAVSDGAPLDLGTTHSMTKGD